MLKNRKLLSKGMIPPAGVLAGCSFFRRPAATSAVAPFFHLIQVQGRNEHDIKIEVDAMAA
jgi:hypothetical protein